MNGFVQRFRVIYPNGMDIRGMGETIYKLPEHVEFFGERISETDVRLMTTGEVISIRFGSIIYAMEADAIEDLYWIIRVSQRHGIKLYRDKFMTEYLYTIPFGVSLTVISRYMIGNQCIYYVAVMNNQYGYVGYKMEEGRIPRQICMEKIRGVLFGRILNRDGVIVRRTKEAYSSIVGIIGMGSLICIDEKDFSDIPQEENFHRFRLWKNRGWINAYCHSKHGNDTSNVEVFGYVPKLFLKDGYENLLDMNICKLEMCPNIEKSEKSISSLENQSITCQLCISCMLKEKNALFLHEGDYGHNVCCLECARKVMECGMKCPICRLPIVKVIQMF